MPPGSDRQNPDQEHCKIAWSADNSLLIFPNHKLGANFEADEQYKSVLMLKENTRDGFSESLDYP